VRHLVGKVKHGKQIDDSEGETRDEESSIGSIPGCGIGSGAEPAGRGFGSLGQLDNSIHNCVKPMADLIEKQNRPVAWPLRQHVSGRKYP
jgi:hypothetical protein